MFTSLFHDFQIGLMIVLLLFRQSNICTNQSSGSGIGDSEFVKPFGEQLNIVDLYRENLQLQNLLTIVVCKTN
jgi:hypothetical protein